MLLKSTRQAQYPQFADFKFTMADTMVDVTGAITGFKNAAGVFEPIPLPPGAIVVGGDVTVETASDDTGVSATIAIGDSANANRYLAATSTKAAGRTALVPTGYRGVGENLRMTLANANGNAVNGTVSVRVEYIIDKRMHETVIV